MERYFIDTHDGTHAHVDHEGLDFSDAEAARVAALSALPDMVKDHTSNGDDRRFLVRVRNDRGTAIYHATLTLSGGWNEGQTDPLADDFD